MHAGGKRRAEDGLRIAALINDVGGDEINYKLWESAGSGFDRSPEAVMATPHRVAISEQQTP